MNEAGMEQVTKEKSERNTRRTSIYGTEINRQPPIISFDNVVKKYQNGVEALKGLSFDIDEGEFVFLMGSSGAGKSTLIKLILLEEQPSSGNIYIHGRNLGRIKRSHIQKYRRSIGVFFQDFRLLERKTVYQNVAFAMEITGASRKEINERVNITLSLMGLISKKKEYPSHLSGGEQQRVALARAIVNGPDILIADEPTGNLDPENSSEIMDLLMKINSLGTTVLVATHEQDMANESGKRIIRLDHGRSLTDGGSSDAGYSHYDGNPIAPEQDNKHEGTEGSEGSVNPTPVTQIPIESVSITKSDTEPETSESAEGTENA